jgi:cell division septum initiation protein DivIVA
MVMRGGVVVDGDGREGRAPGEGVEPPNLRGDLDELMDHRPVFRVRLHGYDRLEVDNYTAWVEGELVAVRRQVDHLLSRFGACSAELEISRRLLADAPRGRDAFPVSERVKEMLRLASDEAAALTESGAQEAERIIDEARTEADARLRKAHEIKEMAVEAADELLEQARRDRATLAASTDRAKAEAAVILQQAAAERERLAELAAREREQAAAAATAHLAAVQAEVDELRRQRDQARQSLRGLSDRIGEALQAVAEMVPEDVPRTHVMRANVAVEGVVRDARDEPDVAVEGMVRDAMDEPDAVVLMGRPAPVPH